VSAASPPVAAPPTLRAVVVMNPRSGGGKVTRFGLVERAGLLGARVSLLREGQDAAALARRAVEDAAEVLGVAGGDGTVSTVAAVAAEADRPLVVVPAGTRNHLARDLGLDIRNPAAALEALHQGEPARIDMGLVGTRPFVNNVSFGVYAEALMAPRYRETKARAMASVARPYLEGRQWVDASVDTPEGRVDHPQVVLLSNNPYHIATPRHLGRRFSLDGGVLGAIVLKRSAESPPPPLPRLLEDMADRGTAGPPREGVITWSAVRVTLRGPAPEVAAGVDGEAVWLPLPLTCEIRPRALRVLLPPDRPGIPREPARPRPPGQRPGDG
jgi:diacylglycerol kinase family enzyme